MTFNCARQPIDIDLFASQLFSCHEGPALPEILVLSLQELAPVPHSLIGGSFISPYLERFEKAVDIAARKHDGYMQNNYKLVSRETIGMTGIMVFAMDMKAIEDIETAGVGVGIWRMGNKGAAAVRFSYQDTKANSNARTELTFVAAHLAAMEEEVSRRNEDWKNIVRGLVFSSKHATDSMHGMPGTEDERPLLSVSSANASIYKPTSHLFLAGDLNYRTSTMKPAPDDHRTTFPQPHHPESSPQHFSKLYEKDQLNQEKAAGRTCHGLIEAPISFAPTYKYNPQEPYSDTDEELLRWSWAKHRWPSWCDRCLYLDIPSWLKRQQPKAQITVHKYSSLPLFPTSDHRPVALSLSLPILAIPEPDPEEDDLDPRVRPPFNIDPDWKSNRERARNLEMLVGLSMYFTCTRQGITILAATTLGVAGCYLILKSLF